MPDLSVEEFRSQLDILQKGHFLTGVEAHEKLNNAYRAIMVERDIAIQQAAQAEADTAAVILALQSLHEYVHGWCEGVPPEHPGSKRWREYDETNREVERVLSQPHPGTALLEALAKLRNGECLKCGMGPLRGSCAYPEACAHPARELGLKHNQVLLELAQAKAALGEGIAIMDKLLPLATVTEEDFRWAREGLAALRARVSK